jgi:uncharacterized protein YdaU (DUF1376 family)
MYYDTEQPISNDINLVSRKIIANSEQELEAISQILSEFFTATDNGFTKKRIEKEIAIYHSKADTARANGKLGGRPKKAKETQDKPNGLIIGTENKPMVNPEESGLKANQELLTNNHKPVTKEKIPYQLIADAYNELFYSNVNNSTECQTISPKRKTAITKLWNLKPNQPTGKVSTNNIDYWKRYFEYSSNQAGLNGGKASKDFDWIADFDALMNFNKYVTNIEGGYA